MAKLYYTPEGQPKPLTKKKYLPQTYKWRRIAVASLAVNLILLVVMWQM